MGTRNKTQVTCSLENLSCHEFIYSLSSCRPKSGIVLGSGKRDHRALIFRLERETRNKYAKNVHLWTMRNIKEDTESSEERKEVCVVEEEDEITPR